MSSPGIQNPEYVQPTFENDIENNQFANSQNDLFLDGGHKTTIQKGPSNFINIHPHQGSNIYDDKDTTENQITEPEKPESLQNLDNWDVSADDDDDESRNEYYDEHLEHREPNSVEFEADYDTYYSSEPSPHGDDEDDDIYDAEGDDHTDTSSDGNMSLGNINFDPLVLEKEDDDLNSESAKFDDSQIREKSEKAVEKRKKLLDNKFLKDLETSVNKKVFLTKQEDHSPYSYIGHRISHSAPFRSFKEYLERSQVKAKVISTSLKNTDSEMSENFDGSGATDMKSQKIAENSPPTVPSKYNTDGSFSEDVVKEIRKRIKRKIKRLPNDAPEGLKKIKNKTV